MTTVDDVQRLLRKYLSHRLPTLSLIDMTSVSADTLQDALQRSIVIARIAGGPPELLIHREDDDQHKPLQIRFANRRQAAVFVASSHALRNDKIITSISELHWNLLQAARQRVPA